MVSQRLVLAVALGVVALGGCKGSKPPVVASVDAVNAPPSRTPGLWSLVATMQGVAEPSTSTLCLDPETDKKLSWWGDAGSDACDTSVEQQADGSWKFSSSCRAPKGDMSIVRRGSARGDFKNAYALDGEFSITGAPNPQLNGTASFTLTASYVGQCPSDMPPGTADIPGVGKQDMLNLGNTQ